MKISTLVSCILLIVGIPLSLLAQPTDFLASDKFNKAIPTPKEVVGVHPGDRPMQHHEVVNYFRKLADTSPRAQYFEVGKTHEGRLLGYLIVSSEDNMSDLNNIKAQLEKVAQPGKGHSIDLNTTIGAAWMMYSIHGDELSGTDAAVQLAYQLTAGTDKQTLKIISELIVGIDPMENPDGRERHLAQLQQWGSEVSNSDAQDIHHAGVWPYGRGNHYFFDLNRDWFILANPESRARMQALVEWNPQLIVDAHEMGPYSTYLFNPPREPINFNVNNSARKWWQVFSKDHSAAFDAYGWSYYTRSWYDDLFPGYGSAMPNYWGSVGLLYEQAQTDGSEIKQPADKISTFKDAVHRQFISSMSNLETAANKRVALLKDFQAVRKNASSLKGAYYIPTQNNPHRVERMIERLLMCGIKVYHTDKSIARFKGLGRDGEAYRSSYLPADTYIVPLGQPLGYLVKAILEFDPRMLNDVLQKEYSDLQKGKGSHLYEVTAWSMLLAYDVDAYFSKKTSLKNATPVQSVKTRKGGLHNAKSAIGFVCSYDDDQVIPALLAMYKAGLKVRSATEPFIAEGKKYDRGTLLLLANENSSDLEITLKEIAQVHRVNIYGLKSMRVADGPDLGGGEFSLLEEPRIAMLTGPDLSANSIGSTWYLLDYELNTRFSHINHDHFNWIDLSRYNVLILPDTWGDLQTYHNILGKPGISKLKDWVDGGGTLIGIKGAAAFLADTSSGFSGVQLRRQALTELAGYEKALTRERLADKKIDSLTIWEGKGRSKPKQGVTEKIVLEELKAMDERGRLFQPRGTIMNTHLDPEHWLNYGAGHSVPVTIYSSFTYLSKMPVETVARYSEAETLRLSGLLWPEAKERWAETAYATREAKGKGQIILFAGVPNYRSYFYGSTRLLLNAMLLGPGMGSNVGVDW